MARLIVLEGPGRGTAYELVEDSVEIGRDPGNGIQIPSETVSRNHATVEREAVEEGESWVIRDLGSRNGVLVNGRRVERAALASGDEIRMGEAVLRFIERELAPIESEDLKDSAEALEVRDVIRDATMAIEPSALPAAAARGDVERRLIALVELGRLAGSAKSYAELFGAIESAVQVNIEPHRTVPILFDERKGLLRPWVSDRGEFDRHLAGVPISSTIVNYVREKRAAILSESAQKDERLEGAASITTHEITSAMCAPIQLGERLLGVIYVDRLGDAERFVKADLELLTAIAVQAAAAVENVRVREERGRERYVREKEARGEYDIVGQCDAMKRVFRFIAKAAPTDASVLIEGASGTGKELVARALHLNSTRRHQPFEAVNCAAMAPTLVESELFGHVRGAFTGADKGRPGRFELADGGTLFLDEIGELPEGSQSKLLRVIESGELRRVGDVKDRKANVRVVAATNKRLSEEIGSGRFREDLYFRLNVLKVSLPLLRERAGDVMLLAGHFLEHFAKKCGRQKLRFGDGVVRVLAGYEWPGNVRELRNLIERMVVMAEGETLRLEDMPYEIRSGPASGAPEGVAAGEDLVPLREVEKDYIARVLRHTGGNKKEAARVLGIDRSTLYAKLKAYGLEG